MRGFNICQLYIKGWFKVIIKFYNNSLQVRGFNICPPYNKGWFKAIKMLNEFFKPNKLDKVLKWQNYLTDLTLKY